MGFLDRLRPKKETARVSSKADVGVDLDEDHQYRAETYKAMREAKKGEEDPELYESREEGRKRRGDSFRQKVAPIRRGVKTARKEWKKFKSDPEVIAARQTFRKTGRRAEEGMGFGHFEGFDAEAMLGWSSGTKSRKTRLEPVYNEHGKRIGSRKVSFQEQQPRERGHDVYDMLGMGGGSQHRRQKRSNDPFDFSDIL